MEHFQLQEIIVQEVEVEQVEQVLMQTHPVQEELEEQVDQEQI